MAGSITEDGIDSTLQGYLKAMRCPNMSEICIPGRKFLAESIATDVSPDASKKRRDVQFLICSDICILSVVHKRATFSRRQKPAELTIFDGANLTFKADDANLLLTVSVDHESPKQKADSKRDSLCHTTISLKLPSKTAFEKIVSNLVTISHNFAEKSKQAISITESSSLGTHSASTLEDSAVPKKPTEPDLARGIESMTLNDKFRVEAVKANAVFDRMEMWAVGGDTGTLKSVDSSASSSGSKHEIQCINVFREILDTELTYVGDIQKLLQEYLRPLELHIQQRKGESSGDQLISTDDIASIFGGIEGIVKMNSELLQSLYSGLLRISCNGEIPGLCETAGVFAKEFMRMLPFFKMYSVYCHQYNFALDRLTYLRSTNKDLGIFLQRREARKKNQQSSLTSLLIKPIQRICKYPLLFRELLNHMNKVGASRPDDTEFMQYVHELEKTEEQVKAIAASVNTKVSDAKNQDHFMKVFQELGGRTGGCPDLVTPSRRFIRVDDVLVRESPYTENKTNKARLYLFNDLIVFAKPTWTNTISKGFGISSTLSRTKGGNTVKCKVTHQFPLQQCRGIKFGNQVDEEGRHNFEMYKVSRAVANSSNKVATSIDRFEVWCDSKTHARSLFHEIESTIESLEENEEMRSSLANKDGGLGTMRGWANRTRTRQWRTGSNTLNKRTSEHYASQSSKELMSASSSESINSIGMKKDSDLSNLSTDSGRPRANIRSYQSRSLKSDMFVSKYAPAPSIKPVSGSKTMNIEVEFPAGPLGIALENCKNPKGMRVACVAALSVAERGGLAVGDRLVSVGDQIIPDDYTWNQVVDIIKERPRPLLIKFQRTAESLASTKQTVESKHSSDAQNATTRSHEAGETRAWAAKLNRRKESNGTSRLLSLKEMEACYTASRTALASTNRLGPLLVKLELSAKTCESDVVKSIVEAVSILREFITTEKDYVCHLRQLVGDFLLPLRQSRSVSLDSRDESAIFMNVENILKVNADLLKGIFERTNSIANSLEHEIDKDENIRLSGLSEVAQAIAKEILLVLPFFKVYDAYARQYNGALTRLTQCRGENLAFDHFLTSRESNKGKSDESFQSLLYKPIERLGKYPTIFSALLECLSSLPKSICSAEVIEDMEKTLKAIEGVAAQVELKLSDAENLERVAEFFKLLGGANGEVKDLVQPNRRFISRDDISFALRPAIGAKFTSASMLLFNDIILLVEHKKDSSGPGSMKLLHSIDLRKAHLKVSNMILDNANRVRRAGSSDDDSKTIHLTHVIRTLQHRRSSKESSSDDVARDTTVFTNIEKYSIRCESIERCKTLSSKIAQLISVVKDSDRSKNSLHNGTTKYDSNRQPSWRSRGSADGAGSRYESMYNTGISTKAALQEIKSRYRN